LDGINDGIKKPLIDIICCWPSPLWVVQEHTIGIVAGHAIWIRQGVLSPLD
jgi:hypothetical protein